MTFLDDLMIAAGRDQGMMRHAKPLWRWLNDVRLPIPRPIVAALYAERQARHVWVPLAAKFFYREALVRYRCTSVGRRLQIEGRIPDIEGNGKVIIGDNVRIGPNCSWFVGHKVSTDASLVVGNNVSLGYRGMISVVTTVTIGDRTMLAGGVSIFDNPSHPISPRKRFHHEPIDLDDAKPVVIGRNCWLGGGAVILRGVTIGDNSIVAAGSIVTKPIPANVLAGGVPATILREFDDDTIASDWEAVASMR
jgi:Acetyltransferase (isoleucine patch superfamily)